MKQLYSRYFPTPSFLAMNSCALDISDQSIKYGELVATSAGLRLGKYGQVKLPDGVVVSGKIENEIEFVRILKDLAHREHIHFARVALQEEQMYLFTLTLPSMSHKNLRETILLQLEEHIPLPALDTIFDYNIVEENKDSLLVEVVAIAAATMESYLSVFEKSGIVPLSFELEAQAIARAVIPAEDKGAVMIVDFGETRTGVSIAHDRRVFFTTTLDIGGLTLTNMLIKNFSLTFEKAEEMKRSYGLDSTSNIDEIFPVILNGISVLRDELNKQYVYWKTHDEYGIKHEQIDKIILCGGAANLIGLADYLQASMNMKVVHANAWVNIYDMKTSIPDMSFQESLGYATILGLTLGDYVYEAQSVINVLPKPKKKALYWEYWKRYATVALSFFALAGVLATVLTSPSYFFSESKYELAEDRLEAFNVANPEIATQNLDSAINDINSKLILLSGKSSTEISDSVLGSILSMRPKGIIYNQILYNEKSSDVRVLELHGVATDRTVLRNFKSALDSNPLFAKVDLPISNFIERSNINFTVSITMK